MPVAALDGLRACIQEMVPNLQTLPEAELLLLRSAETLHHRLELCVEVSIGISAAMFSPADLWALEELAEAKPRWQRELAELARAIEQEVG